MLDSVTPCAVPVLVNWWLSAAEVRQLMRLFEPVADRGVILGYFN